jgi:hypothetical protein
MLGGMKPRLLVLGLSLLLSSAACGDDEGDSSGSGASGSGASGGGTETCSGAMVVLQKDAYREVAGRSTELWPPHTTTELTWSCPSNSNVSTTSFRSNHGTEPTDTDANGDVFLVDVGSFAVSGTAAELSVLHDAYDACECGTAFLSLDALQDQAVQDVVNALANYITMNLTCSGTVDAMGLVGLLQMGEIDAVIAEIPNCTWAAGSDWAGGFDEALNAIIMAAMETLADYHVCNNDALLQAKLIDTFVQTGEVVACDGDDMICHGPQWFYTP